MHLLIGQGVGYRADWLDKRSVVCLILDGWPAMFCLFWIWLIKDWVFYKCSVAIIKCKYIGRKNFQNKINV